MSEAGRRDGRRSRAGCPLAVLFLCWMGCAPAALPAAGQPEPVFSLSFDGTVRAEEARGKRAPTRTRGHSFVDGVKGRAVLVAPGGELRYEAAGNLDKEKGTLSLWFRPSWNVSGPGLHFLFREDSLIGSGRNLFVLHTYPGWVQFLPGEGAGPFRKGQVFWRSGEWHHVAYAWNRERGSRLYLDGRAVSHNLYDRIHIEEPFSWDVVEHDGFLLGDGHLPADGLFAAGETAFDELRVFGQALSGRQVMDIYCQAGGFPDVYLPWNAFPAGRRSDGALRLVNPCPETRLRGTLAYRIASRQGETLVEARSVEIDLPAPGGRDVPLRVPDLAPGEYDLFTTWNGEPRTLRALSLWVYRPGLQRASLDPSPSGSASIRAPGQSRPPSGKEVARIHCVQDRDAHNFRADKGARPVSSPLGEYLETGARRFSRMAFRFTVEKPHVPHRLVLTYPDDRERLFDIIVNSPRFPGVYDVGTGLALGRENLLTGRLQEHPILFWPREEENALVLMTWEEGKPAAAAEIVVEELGSGLEPLAFEAPPAGLPERQVGLYWEDPRFDATLGWPAEEPEGFDRAAANLMAYMRHVGMNTLLYPTVTYGGPFFSSETQGFRGSNRYGSHPLNFVEILLSRCGEAGVGFFSVFNMAGTIRLIDRAQESLEQGTSQGAGFRTVTKDGQATQVWGENLRSLFNPLHPVVQEEVKELVREHVRRFGRSEAFRGVSFHLAAENLPWLGSLDQGYDDDTVARFERDTGIAVEVGADPEKRAARRYRWIMDHCREDWVRWRCRKIAEFYAELAGLLREDGRERELVLSVFMPCGRGVDVARWALGRQTVESILLEAGFDARALARIPGIRIHRFFHPSDYRRVKSDRGDRDPAALHARDIFFDAEAIEAVRTEGNTGVNFFHVYFENERGETPIPGYWWEPQRWRVSTVAAGGVSYLEYPAHAVASLDPWLVSFCGFQIPTIGHEEHLVPFIKALRSLPAVPFSTVAGMDDPVAMRTARCGDRLYLYLVNREPHPVKVGWSFDGAGAGDLRVRDLVGETFLSFPSERGGARSVRLELQPYELRSYWVEPADVAVQGARSEFPPEAGRRLEETFSLLQDRASSGWRVGRESPALARTMQELADAFSEVPRPYARIRHLLGRSEVQRVLK